MTPSLENRQRIALLVFFVGDHMLWYYGGHFQQVSLFYVVVSEVVRVGALVATVGSFAFLTIANKYLFYIAVYCYAMIPLNYWGDSEKSMFYLPLVNLLWFKKDSTIPIDHGFTAFFLYILYLFFLSKICNKKIAIPYC